MKDERLTQLAKTLVNHSIELKQGDKVLITAHLPAKPLVIELVEEIYAKGGSPFVRMMDPEILKHLVSGLSREQAELENKWDLQTFKDIDCVIHIAAEENDAEFSEIPADKFQLYGEATKEASDYVVDKTRWVLLNYPTSSLAQKAGMSTAKFTDYLLNVCNVDYEKMGRAQIALKDLMERTDRVRIVSPGTDLSFSIKDIPAVPCFGKRNVPDGEVYTAPVRDSVNGTIKYNTPCPYRGKTYHDVTLTFKDGKIINAEADQTEKINEIFDTDDGARYIGEFAIGLNPLITEPMGDILFDEKICGSIHFTPGDAYEEADNGNNSSVHWDMVLIQRPEYGGGELYFDDVLIRKDGEFVIDELKALNPDSLNPEKVTM